MPTISSHSSSRAKAVHFVAPIFFSCNYYGNLAHKANECNILSKELFCDYCGERRTFGSYLFCQVLKPETTSITKVKSAGIFLCPSTKSQGTSTFHSSLPPPRVIPVKMLKRRSNMLTRGRCFKPMPLKFKLCKMNSNHWGPNLLI